jgi:4-hydroxythreonine-4-phosphate dehydrogenase
MHGTASDRARIALTPGEPAGIGPDICVMLAQDPPPARLVAVADPKLLRARAARLGLPLSLIEFDSALPPPVHAPATLEVLPVRLAAPAECGHLDPANAGYVLETLRMAVRGCQGDSFDAMVTGPVHKGAINDAGIAFSGHTELLAELTGGGEAVMMLAAPGLRVALVTTHLPLRAVPEAITPQRLEHIARTLHRELRARFGIADPRVLVCGLNPHAGEWGHLGGEEREVIEPVLARLRAEGMRLEGPLPADTLFTPTKLQGADAVLAMYHDQGLPVLKHLGFGQAANITLGLPIVRTSVDHGTALELAGTGRADPGSLRAAVRVALEMVAARAAHGA